MRVKIGFLTFIYKSLNVVSSKRSYRITLLNMDFVYTSTKSRIAIINFVLRQVVRISLQEITFQHFSLPL